MSEKEIRPIDANDTIEKLRANFQQASSDGCEDPLYQIAEDTIAEMPTIGFVDGFYPEAAKQLMISLEKSEKAYLNHLFSAAPLHPDFHQPLTLEQLRQMDGKPVWGVSLISGKPGEWFIVHIVEMSQTWFIACAGAGQGFGDKDNYGITWIAYAYPPAHIDREAWTAEWKEYSGADAGFHYCSKCNQQAFNYEDGGDVVEVLSDFCPGCARAMTPKAWAIVENRLMGG